MASNLSGGNCHMVILADKLCNNCADIYFDVSLFHRPNLKKKFSSETGTVIFCGRHKKLKEIGSADFNWNIDKMTGIVMDVP